MPHNSFLTGPTGTNAPLPLDLVIDQPAAIAEHFDFAMGLQAALTVSLIEAGLDVVPALEVDPDPMGALQIVYSEQPRSREEFWAEIDERRLAPEQALQMQIYVSGQGVGLDARIAAREGSGAATRILFEPGESSIQELIQDAVTEILHAMGAKDTQAPNILELLNAEDGECLGMLLPTLGAAVRFDFGEGATPVHRELLRANKGFKARDASVAEARRLLN